MFIKIQFDVYVTIKQVFVLQLNSNTPIFFLNSILYYTYKCVIHYFLSLQLIEEIFLSIVERGGLKIYAV